MNKALFGQLSRIAYDKGGILLKEGKETLVSARLGKRLRALGLSSVEDYLELLSGDDEGEELVQFLDAISTNFTSFMREPDHFDLLSEQFSKWHSAGQRRFRFWCAASSSGEEPYSIAITILDALDGRQGTDFKILATDISTKVLGLAAAGVYEEARLEPLSRLQRSKYFDKRKQPGGAAAFEVKPLVKKCVVYKRLNLSVIPFPMAGPLDFVFCRNVMIYFDANIRQRVVGESERLLKPGGYLITGHSETLSGLKTGLEAIRPSIYRKPP